MLAEAEALAKVEAQVAVQGRVRTGKTARDFSELLWSYTGGYGGVAGVSPAEGVAENDRALFALAVAAWGRLPPIRRHKRYDRC